jgi:hypothetical protein
MGSAALAPKGSRWRSSARFTSSMLACGMEGSGREWCVYEWAGEDRNRWVDGWVRW